MNIINKCNLCRYNSFDIISKKLRNNTNNLKIYKCKSCGHIQLLPQPSNDSIKKFYDEDKQEKLIRPEHDFNKLTKNNQVDIQRRINVISNNFHKNIEILDIGCGYGFFLNEMDKRGYNIKGLEISKERRNIAKNFVKVPIYENYENEKYDLITLFHVLEHTINPIKFCKNIYDHLNKNGCVFIEVPNVEELMLKTCSSYNEFYWIQAHLNYFSKKSLTKVLKESGFKNIDVRYVQRYGVENLCNWLMYNKPQLDDPVFKIKESYKWLEQYYRKNLENFGMSDTLFVLAYV